MTVNHTIRFLESKIESLEVELKTLKDHDKRNGEE